MKYVYFYAKFWWINTFLAPVTARIHGSAALSAGLACGLLADSRARLSDIWLAGLSAGLSAGLLAGLSA